MALWQVAAIRTFGRTICLQGPSSLVYEHARRRFFTEYDLNIETMNLSSLSSFIAKLVSLHNIKQQNFLITCFNSIVKTAYGDSLFRIDDNNIADIREHEWEHWILLLSDTQLVGSKFKDTSFCKFTGESEGSASNLTIFRSVLISQVCDNPKNNTYFQNRARRNENAKDLLHG